MFVVDFDGREPAGPMMVGPFPSGVAADDWVAAQRLDSCAYSVVPMADPEES